MMQQAIEQVSLEIRQQQPLLLEQVERTFAPFLTTATPQPVVVTKKKTPPITYICGALSAGFAAWGAVQLTNEKSSGLGAFVSIGVAAASAYGAYRTLPKKQLQPAAASAAPQGVSKHTVIDALNQLVRKIDQTWEDFMVGEQKKVRESIEALSIDTNAKLDLQSKIYTYEIVDVSLRELIANINDASEAELPMAVRACAQQLKTAIEKAVADQLQKYAALNG